jgi:GDPmannose 4,6-dehydratase
MKKVVLITGISGQDGSYLSKFLLEKKYKIVGFIRSCESLENLEYLGIKDQIVLEECDLLNLEQVKSTILKYKLDEIYNFAAQSSVKLSFDCPQETYNFNIMSVVNLLEAIRTTNKKIKLFQASSCEMFGRVENLPANENTLFNPLNPYSVSKVAAHQIVKNYRQTFKLFACCGILFHHESFLRGKDFFIKKVIRQALEIKAGKRDCLYVGNIDIKRDFGFAPEYVKAMWMMLQHEQPDDFIISSGSSISLREIIYYVFDKLGLDRKKIVVDQNLFRPVDIEQTLGDNSKIREIVGWHYNLSFFEVLDLLLEEEMRNMKISIEQKPLNQMVC